jgi:signal transduction histidine kinase
MIQEKLASVGMLTAGIAHEIKNPLNFINNFADMTVELLDELKEELEKPLENAPEETKQAVNSTIDDIVINCKKINEHGKRAESIIKNMLIQARTSDVEKAPLDINALLEEYLNLAYHGMRAQHNKLNVKIDKNIDKSILPVMVDQQSIGRVFLNIINNGLYAANDKAEKINGDFMPTITITSEQDENNVTVKIKDNGNGIPEHIRAKIFEPFFTTKPAGQGTGLGLSICYDIVVSEHGGSLDVVSSPGEYTEFIIKLPKNVSSEKK